MPARFYHTSVVDSNGFAYIIGGYDGLIYYNDIWKYNGTTFTQLSSGTFPMRQMHTSVINIYLNQIFTVGGYSPVKSGDVNDVWQFSSGSSFMLKPKVK